MHAHILFKDSAYTWYTTYHDRFDCWNTLEHYLRLRYDNPNQDSIIKFELHNRKQRPNEKFSAFLTDLEFLAQRLTYRVPEKEIFELAKANMKLSYQRRLVLVTIESLDHLSNLCSRMDALEASLNKSTVHQIDLEEGCLEDEHDPELVYALQGRQGKCVRSKKENQPGSAEQRMESKFKPSFKPTRVSAQLKLVAPRRQIEWLNVNKLIFDQALDLARRLVRLVLSRCVCGHGRSAIYRWLLPNERTVARDPGWCTWTTNWRAADAYRARHVEQRVSGHVGKRTKPASLRRRRASRSARVDARDHPAEPEQASRPVLVVAFLEVPRTHRK
ncbi:hypothetical protein pipiens_003646 [Culex pipiens pipiens]|uniref:Retrotransposon gag domain-containing protein n=1 Tax=Culex pipiens pipiens TaxID=38569 RepID=A0ABD1CUE6_CULPP